MVLVFSDSTKSFLTAMASVRVVRGRDTRYPSRDLHRHRVLLWHGCSGPLGYQVIRRPFKGGKIGSSGITNWFWVEAKQVDLYLDVSRKGNAEGFLGKKSTGGIDTGSFWTAS